MTPETNAIPRSGSRYQQRVSTFLASRRGKMFGFAEVAALAGSCLVFLLVLLSYLYFFLPARAHVSSLNTEKERLQTNLQTLETVVKKERNTREQVDEVAASLNDFETSYLWQPDQGRLDLYDELNQLIIKNGLRNTSGPTYTPLDPAGTKSVGGRTTTTKWQSYYPGIAVMVTVEGEYQNVRHFIRDIERSKQFVVINEVELQRANDNNAPASADEGTSNPRGSLISLQLNMATYFQRNIAHSTTSQAQQ